MRNEQELNLRIYPHIRPQLHACNQHILSALAADFVNQGKNGHRLDAMRLKLDI